QSVGVSARTAVEREGRAEIEREREREREIAYKSNSLSEQRTHVPTEFAPRCREKEAGRERERESIKRDRKRRTRERRSTGYLDGRRERRGSGRRLRSPA